MKWQECCIGSLGKERGLYIQSGVAFKKFYVMASGIAGVNLIKEICWTYIIVSVRHLVDLNKLHWHQQNNVYKSRDLNLCSYGRFPRPLTIFVALI